MLFWTIVKVAIKSLASNKMRSFLAMLGIIIGVGAVIAMLALGSGAQKQVLDRISAMGTNLLIVRPAQRGFRGVMSGTQQNLTLDDAKAVVNEVEGVRQVAPVVGGNAQLKYLAKNSRTSIVGTSIEYFPIRNFEIERGRAFTEGECERMARVALLGPATVRDLFGADDPLEQVIKLRGVNFRVIGVLKSKGDQGWFNPDDQAIVPYTTAMKQLFGQDFLREIDIQAKDGVNLNDVQDRVTTLLRKRHRTQPDADNDFQIQNQAEMLETMSSVTQTFTLLLGGIAGISLLVGGIGIMNIMLVTVTERTREIGVRKAIGAKERDILSQFLLEAVVMSGLGGVLGIALGFGLARLIPTIGALSGFSPVVTPDSVVLAITFSAGVGIFFGFYPARRASRLDPIEALRYE
jgi:putative ABC transport system permease protein